MQFETIESIFEGFESQKVLVIGDVMIDSYLWGEVSRISPEAPVPIVDVRKRQKRLGGAANVAVNVQALGATPILCAVIGKDADAQDFLQLMQDQNLSTEGIFESEMRITTIKHRILAGHQQMLRVDSEMSHAITESERNSLFRKIEKLLPECNVVVFEDYDKGVLDKILIEQVVALAQKLQIPTVVDPKKRNFLQYKNTTLFKPNLKELKEGLKIDLDANNLNEIKNAVNLLKKQLSCTQVMVTLSEKGILIADDEVLFHEPAHLRQIADVSGAGDTVIGVAALCVALGLSANFIARLSNLAGGLVCEYVGVVPIQKQELLEEAKQFKLLV